MAPKDDILNQSEFRNDKELEKFLSNLEQLRVPSKKSKEKAWEELTGKMESGVTVREPVFLRIRPFLYAAAAVAAFVITSWFVYQYLNTENVFVPKGKMAQIILPDGSKVTLNSFSSISYKKRGFSNKRMVKTEGEALFEVKKGTPFIVLTGNQKIEVLGTSFNVFSRDDILKVQCLTGMVRVDIPGVKPLVLGKGSGIHYVKGEEVPDIVPVEPSEAISWTKGEFFYESVPLQQVFREVERQFDVTIQSADLKDRIYTGYFKNNDLETALENICLPMSLHYKIEGKMVKIR